MARRREHIYWRYMVALARAVKRLDKVVLLIGPTSEIRKRQFARVFNGKRHKKAEITKRDDKKKTRERERERKESWTGWAEKRRSAINFRQ